MISTETTGSISHLRDKTVGLARYDAMLLAIEKCHRVDEALKIKATARALEVYAKQALNTEAEYRAREIRIRAERRTGELLKETARNGHRAARGQGGIGKSGRKGVISDGPTLPALGLSADQSSRFQKLADIPSKQFEELISEPHTSTEEILTRAGKIEPPPEVPVDRRTFDTRALWVWGILTDFDEKRWQGKSMLELDPGLVVSKMTAVGRKDSVRMIPLVIDWLGKLLVEAERDD